MLEGLNFSFFKRQPVDVKPAGTAQDYQEASEIVDNPKVEALARAKINENKQRFFVSLGETGIISIDLAKEQQNLAGCEACVRRRQSRLSRAELGVSDQAKNLAAEMKIQELGNQKLKLTPDVAGEGVEMRSNSADKENSRNGANRLVMSLGDPTIRQTIRSSIGLEDDLAAFRMQPAE